jgi:hypothetical protein
MEKILFNKKVCFYRGIKLVHMAHTLLANHVQQSRAYTDCATKCKAESSA